MRALVIGTNSSLIMNAVSALAAAGAEVDVISDKHLPRGPLSSDCRDYVRVSPESLDFAAPSGKASRFIASYCQTYGIDIVVPTDSQDCSQYLLECNPCVWGTSMSIRAAVDFIRLGTENAGGKHRSEAELPRRISNAKLPAARRAPAGISVGALSFRKQAHRDAWIQAAGRLAQQREVFRREMLARASA